MLVAASANWLVPPYEGEVLFNTFRAALLLLGGAARAQESA